MFDETEKFNVGNTAAEVEQQLQFRETTISYT